MLRRNLRQVMNIKDPRASALALGLEPSPS
jgi:hypothetical protein